MREVNFTPADEIVDQLRSLHSYTEEYNELSCQGCDWGGFEGEEPGWPCRTAKLVYSEAEIAEVVDAIEMVDRWSHQRWLCTASHRARNPGPFDFMNPDLYLHDLVFPKIPVARATGISYKYQRGF